MNRRAFLWGATATTAGGLVALGAVVPRGKALVPPGAGSFSRFKGICTACGLCVASCPSKVLMPAGLADYGLLGLNMPKAVFTEGYCEPDCTRCAEVCPAGALMRFTPETRVTVRPGVAVWSRFDCRTTAGEACSLCHDRCPCEAIALEKDEGATVPHPVVKSDACIGCGACEHYCPATPKAIRL